MTAALRATAVWTTLTLQPDRPPVCWELPLNFPGPVVPTAGLAFLEVTLVPSVRQVGAIKFGPSRNQA
jgi:hypothetical protein